MNLLFTSVDEFGQMNKNSFHNTKIFVRINQMKSTKNFSLTIENLFLGVIYKFSEIQPSESLKLPVTVVFYQ